MSSTPEKKTEKIFLDKQLSLPYMKLIHEALTNLKPVNGALRKDIWAFIMKKYGDRVHYRDFLLAVRKF